MVTLKNYRVYQMTKRMKKLSKENTGNLISSFAKAGLTIALVVLVVSPVAAQSESTEGLNLPVWVQAGLWGLFAGSTSFVGAAIGYAVHLPQRVIAGIMAFGSGVLISALSFELMEALGISTVCDRQSGTRWCGVIKNSIDGHDVRGNAAHNYYHVYP